MSWVEASGAFSRCDHTGVSFQMRPVAARTVATQVGLRQEPGAANASTLALRVRHALKPNPSGPRALLRGLEGGYAGRHRAVPPDQAACRSCSNVGLRNRFDGPFWRYAAASMGGGWKMPMAH